MPQEWAERQRRTNRLVRIFANYIFSRGDITSEQLYGICKLTWITSSYDGKAAAYIKSTKIPAIGDVFAFDYSGQSLSDVASDVVTIVNSSESEPLILAHTGFTHFYKAYRNSARDWLIEHHKSVAALFSVASSLKTDQQGMELTKKIKQLPGIPKANSPRQRMRPEYLLTPALFALDPRMRFPLINGNKGVKKLLSAIGASRDPLDEQYSRMVALYGIGGVEDAADLDQVGHERPDFIAIAGKMPSKKLLENTQTNGNVLPLKDASDIEVIQRAKSVTQRRLHNGLTNTVRKRLTQFRLLEGCDDSALFDVRVEKYNTNGDDLLIEAKSSIERAHVRMGIGQLFDYWFMVKGACKPHVALLTPSEPERDTKELLEWLKVGVLWLTDERLQTSTASLKHLCDN
jgi:hypothetical protein